MRPCVRRVDLHSGFTSGFAVDHSSRSMIYSVASAQVADVVNHVF
jgi:hypothetical protein